MLVHKAPKLGNDDDYVDLLADALYRMFIQGIGQIQEYAVWPGADRVL